MHNCMLKIEPPISHMTIDYWYFFEIVESVCPLCANDDLLLEMISIL